MFLIRDSQEHCSITRGQKNMPGRNRIPEGVRTVRSDLTNWLWHFVRRDDHEIETIRSIIESKTLECHTDYLTKEKVICFTEAPLAEHIRQNAILTDNDYTRMSLFGVGFRRPWLYQKGALPVIYEPNSLLESLPPEQRWRHVEFDLTKPVDFTWQREWRLHQAIVSFTEEDVILVIPDTEDLKEHLWEFVVDVQDEHGELMICGGYFNRWNFIPLEYEDIQTDTDIEVCLGKSFTDIIPEEHEDLREYI